MRSRVHLAERVDGDVRVDLRRRDRGVAEELLYDAHVGAAREQVGRETVPQGVRGPALHEEASGWELGDLTRENARGPIPTTERELELMCTWWNIRGAVTEWLR